MQPVKVLLKAWLVCAFAISIAAQNSATAVPVSSAIATPQSVVTAFCAADYRGVRTTSWADIDHLVLWAVEPGWDIMSVIRAFKVVKTEINGRNAKVTVEYQVLGQMEGGIFDNKPKVERVTFTVILGETELEWRNNRPVAVTAPKGWRIKSPIIPPHESLDVEIQSARYWSKRLPSDPNRQRTLRQLEALAVRK